MKTQDEMLTLAKEVIKHSISENRFKSIENISYRESLDQDMKIVLQHYSGALEKVLNALFSDEYKLVKDTIKQTLDLRPFELEAYE